jgi:NAD(P)-dependent dehydrogenase (short-subunit alcohol dehydrogenase family)
MEDFATNGYPQSRQSDLDETVRLVQATGQRIFTAKVDVRERSAMIAAVNAGVLELGHLEVVVANAGICPLGQDKPVSAWLDAVSVDLVGVINTIEAALPHLKAGASIISTGSVAGLKPGSVDSMASGPGGAGYGHAKRGVARLTHELALQLAPHAIRVNAVHPTNCNTDMLHNEAMYKLYRSDLEHPTREDAMVTFPHMQKLPIPYVEPVDISNAVLWLASEESRFVTGQQLKVDGGALLDSTTSGAPY